ncbi:hypothetical protein [Myxococcus qinghaiensis]|uniref:hypothetical protein n=1 Tax=Myxococcus qinghaiensis TaxID=2906758 RepID=UPI0020A73E52|nr:hypothetical protein [Myxococcus qinghaiensis]MCP3166656.1 hypothetical protein [Myxococcus qinghaiensis]
MSNILNDLLARATESFERHEEEEALQRLLEGWSEARAEPLIALAQQLSDRLAVGLTPLDVSSSWWQTREPRHLMDLPRELMALLAHARQGNRQETAWRIPKFRERAADPRLVPPLLAIALMPVAEDSEVLDALCGLLMHVGPPYDVNVLHALRGRLPAGLSFWAEKLDIVIRMGAAWVPPILDEETQARCEVLREAIDARTATERRVSSTREALLARIHAVPEDDSSRRVLADQLLELGDPLGEFIVLQYAEVPDEDRILQLLVANREKWEAPLGSVIERGCARFARGFPVAVRMKESIFAQGEPVPGPAWGTVEELDWNDVAEWAGPAVHWSRWLTHPHLRGVVRMRNVSEALARELGAHALPVRRLEVKGAREPRLFQALAALPHLTWLELSRAEPSAVALCAASSLAPRLHRFDASLAGAWKLSVDLGAEVPVQATLVSERHVDSLVTVLRAAARFSDRGLRLSCQRKLDAGAMERLKAAASLYARVD